jgi:transcriptional regulator with XRE-family HTH domain
MEYNRKGGIVMVTEYMKVLRTLREDAELTQTEVAEILGTSQTMYARYERGASALPIRHLVALCNLYKVSADEILGLPRRRRKNL